MIDYLMLLLETQEREEETETPGWSELNWENTIGRAGTAEKGTVPQTEMVVERGVEPAVVSGAADLGEPERQAEWSEFAVTRLGSAAEMNGNLLAAARRSGGAAQLYQQVRRRQIQAGHNRPVANATPLVAPGIQTEVRSIGLEGLDRMFQRDARRYDGGFTLF